MPKHMTRKDMDLFAELATPVIRWLKKNRNPHAKIVIDANSAELVYGEALILDKSKAGDK